MGSANLIASRLRPGLSNDGLVAIDSGGKHIVLGVAHGRTPGPKPVMSVPPSTSG